MKTSVSLPAELLERVDRLAKRQKLSRSAFFRHALEAYVLTFQSDVTSQIDAALAQIGDDPVYTAWTQAATAHALWRTS